MRSMLTVLCATLALGCARPATLEAVPSQNAWLHAGREAAEEADARVGPIRRARSVILFVGDGMGMATVTAARILEGQRRGETGEENLLSFETLPFTALSKTYNTDFQVPDSAGAMTAMVTGAKTRMGVLAFDESVARGAAAPPPSARLETLLEQAEDRGLWTGIVTTTTVTHATPAACYAHSAERNWESDAARSPDARAAGFPDIASQLVDFGRGDGIEVVLGGGRSHFLPANAADPERSELRGLRGDGRDLIAAWRARFPDGVFVWRRAEFEAVDGRSAHRLLGLFEPFHMQFENDRARDAGGEPSLSEMTAKALEVLTRAPNGFFLMVEGGRIDHGHHAGNAQRALAETIELSNAVRVALERTDREDTLVVVTADHSHTLTIAGYPRRGNPILGLVVGAAGEASAGDDPVPDLSGRPYSTLGYANGPGHTGETDVQPEGPKRFPHFAKRSSGVASRPEPAAFDSESLDHLQEATVPLPSETHAGEDVPIWAGGPGAELFHGTREQSYVYHAIARALGWHAGRARGSAPWEALLR